jgi:hypothetical protein
MITKDVNNRGQVVDVEICDGCHAATEEITRRPYHGRKPIENGIWCLSCYATWLQPIEDIVSFHNTVRPRQSVSYAA